ncbi:MAG: redoxin domain-containing protein [Bacteroidales bacterium]
MKKILISSLFSLCLWTANAQSYQIDVQIDGLSNTHIYLGYFDADKKYIIDTIMLNKEGKGSFSKNKELARGMYFIVTPNNRFFDFLISENQKFSIQSNNNLRENIIFTGSAENQAFAQHQYIIAAHKEIAKKIQLRMHYNAQKANDSIEIYQEQLSSNEKMVHQYTQRIIANYGGEFLSTLLKAQQKEEVPNIRNIKKKSVIDSIREAYFSRFFDNIDVTDNGLIRTPFFRPTLDFFFKKLISPSQDTIIKYADKLIKRSKSNPEMLRYLTEYFLAEYQNSPYLGHENIIVYLADNYLLTDLTPWIDDDYKAKLREYVDMIRPVLIGSIAPDFRMQSSENKRLALHKIPAEWTILVFYVPNSTQCQKEMKAIWRFYQAAQKDGVQVVAMYTQYKQDEWKNFLAETNYNWINAWDGFEGKDEKGKNTIYSLGSNYRSTYNLRTAPSIYLLDKEKKIVARNLNAKKIIQLINTLKVQK